MAENLCDLLYAPRRSFFISGSRQATYTFTCGNKDITIIVFREIHEGFLGNTMRHKFIPRTVIDYFDEIININIFVQGDVSTVNH